MNEFLDIEAVEEERVLLALLPEADQQLPQSDSSQTRVLGHVSSDEEDSSDDSYESDFINDETTDYNDSTDDSDAANYYPLGLPRFVASQLPESSLLFTLTKTIDTIHNMAPKTKNVKSNVPLKYEEKLANQEITRAQSEEDEIPPSKIDRLVTEQLNNRRAKQKQIRQKTETATATITINELPPIPNEDEDDSESDPGPVCTKSVQHPRSENNSKRSSEERSLVRTKQTSKIKGKRDLFFYRLLIKNLI